MEILFITGNKEKVAIAKTILNKENIKVLAKKIDCPEIQSDDNEIIASSSARYASNLEKSNVVKVDTGFYIEALNGFPGPYAEYIERKLDCQDILNLMKNKKNRKAYYKEVLAYQEYGKEPITFTTYTYGTISNQISGDKGYNFDKIFICDGDNKTMANYDDSERIKKYSNENWKNLVEYLKENKNSHWKELYQKDIDKKGGNIEYVMGKIKKKKKLINLIKKYADKKIIECGSGTAVVSLYLSTLGYDVTAIDIEDDVLELSKKLARDYYHNLKNDKLKINFKKESIFKLNYSSDYFDVAFSNGVLEHFQDDEIINIIKEQLKIAKITIVGIPTKYFESKEAKYGNERVLKLSYWRKLIKQSGGKIIQEVGMNREPLKKRIFNYKKYFKPRPYHLFVIKK